MNRGRGGGSVVRRLMVVPVPWIFVLAYLIGVGLEYGVQIRIEASPPFWVGAAVFGAGLGLAGWGWGLFQHAGTTRVPGEASAALVTSGPYRVSRNPMYVGLSVAYVGEALMLRQVWPTVMLLAVLLYLDRVVIPVEETRLRAVFGDSYERYCNTVRRWV